MGKKYYKCFANRIEYCFSNHLLRQVSAWWLGWMKKPSIQPAFPQQYNGLFSTLESIFHFCDEIRFRIGQGKKKALNEFKAF